jgi:hypothetical protein
MRIDTRFIGFGLFFLVFGVTLLAVQQGWIPDELIERAWQLWPLLLIGAGVSILLSGRRAAEIGGLVISATLGVMAAGLVSGGGIPFSGCGGDASGGAAFERQSGELRSPARVEVEFNCGDLAVGMAEGSTWALAGTTDEGVVPDIEVAPDGVRIESSTGRGVFGIADARALWTLDLPAEPTIELDVAVNAGAGSMVLGDGRLGNVQAAANAGSIRVDLRDVVEVGIVNVSVNAGSAVVWLPELAVEGEVSANAGSATICAPDGIGLRLIVGSNPISSNDYGSQGLVQVGDAWETPDFASADVKTTLRTEANAGSLSLNSQRTCGS